MPLLGLYLHIPYCKAKCGYCDFLSRPLSAQRELDSYTRALKHDIALAALPAAGRQLTSIYFGGGTPSLLGPGRISAVLKTVKRSFDVGKDAEITLEANPATVTAGQWRRLRAAGISRISLGVQTFDDRLLRLLGRIHTGKQAAEAVEQARQAGFENISTDLIYGIPGQTEKDWKKDLARIIGLRVSHVSFYDLTIEPGTDFGRRRRSLKLVDERKLIRMYTDGCRKLAAAGYRQYEISSFARKGRQSRHNQIYWHNESSIGCGAGAFSIGRERVFINAGTLTAILCRR